MSTKELSNNDSVPTTRNNIMMNITHHNKNPFFEKQNPKKLYPCASQMINSSQFDVKGILQKENGNLNDEILKASSDIITKAEMVNECTLKIQISPSNFIHNNIDEIQTQNKKIHIENQINNIINDNKEINPKQEELKEQNKDNIDFNNLKTFDKLQEQMKQQKSISDDIYILMNLTSQITDEIKKNFEIIKELSDTPESEIISRKVNLKKTEKKFTNKTLVLDLDDTLVHTLSDKKVYSQKDLKNLEINSVSYFEPNKGLNISIKYIIRPYALSFLQNIFPFYEIILFTASDQNYANAIIDKLDPEKAMIDYRLYRQHCIKMKNHYIKNLKILHQRDLKDILIVDNSIVSFKENFDNGIYISSFSGDSTDRELIKLCDFLKSKMLLKADDVRTIIKNEFPLGDMYKIYKKSLIE